MQEEPIPSSNGTSSGLDDMDKRLDECFASMAALQSWTVDMKKGLAELQEINNSNRELRNDIRAGLVHGAPEPQLHVFLHFADLPVSPHSGKKYSLNMLHSGKFPALPHEVLMHNPSWKAVIDTSCIA